MGDRAAARFFCRGAGVIGWLPGMRRTTLGWGDPPRRAMEIITRARASGSRKHDLETGTYSFRHGRVNDCPVRA
jgi:hypothetical protein